MHVKVLNVVGFKEGALFMRLPLNSEKMSDTISNELGPKDFDLIKRLTKAGSDHSKILRMIQVYALVKMPFNWWKHYDTYKVGTTAISRSTMHKGLGDRLLTKNDFYVDVWNKENQLTLDLLNNLQEEFFYAKENKLPTKELWRRLIDLMPCSMLQERGLNLNYQVLLNILGARYQVEKLSPEWNFFCEEMLNQCPYLSDLWEVVKSKRTMTTEEFRKMETKK